MEGDEKEKVAHRVKLVREKRRKKRERQELMVFELQRASHFLLMQETFVEEINQVLPRVAALA